MLEIMTVVVIALFIGMLAGPALVRRMPEYRLDGAVSAAVGELRAARMAAISEGRPVTAEVDSGGGVGPQHALARTGNAEPGAEPQQQA